MKTRRSLTPTRAFASPIVDYACLLFSLAHSRSASFELRNIDHSLYGARAASRPRRVAEGTEGDWIGNPASRTTPATFSSASTAKSRPPYYFEIATPQGKEPTEIDLMTFSASTSMTE